MNIYKITQKILGWEMDAKQNMALVLVKEIERLQKENEELIEFKEDCKAFEN